VIEAPRPKAEVKLEKRLLNVSPSISLFVLRCYQTEAESYVVQVPGKKSPTITISDNDDDTLRHKSQRIMLAPTTLLYWKQQSEHHKALTNLATEHYKVILMTRDPYASSDDQALFAREALQEAVNSLEMELAVPHGLALRVSTSLSYRIPKFLLMSNINILTCSLIRLPGHVQLYIVVTGSKQQLLYPKYTD
jgi:hypothetical protein